MNPFLIELYKKFLYGKITKSEFGEMRFEMNKTSNEEFAGFEQNEWNDFVIREKMLKDKKTEIRNNLKFFAGQQSQIKSRGKIWLKIAAVLVPLTLVGSLFLFLNQKDNSNHSFLVEVARGNKATVTLPDNSKAWINSNSSLNFIANSNESREIKMNGEVFFQVFKDKKRPFIISFDDIKIEVLGTSFNVKAYKNRETIETSLVEGSVKISGHHLSREFILKPNEKAIYNRKSNNLTIVQTNNELETAWKSNVLRFDTERFGDVMNMLEDWYDITINNQYPQIENDLITGSFKNEGIESVMDILKVQYNINYTRNGKIVTILPVK